MENVLDKLTEEQSKVALQIARKAKDMGIDPRLAIALAYRESGLNPQAKGSKGEVGLMQVMPATAKGLGFTPDELADPSKNIEIGLTYLKRGLDKFGGDPVLAVAGYNAGLDHPYFTDPENKPLPASTKEYIKGINGLGGFGSPQAAEDDAPQQVDSPASESDFQAQKARIAADLTAAGIGAGVAKGVDITKNIGDTAAAIRQLPAAMTASSMPSAPTAPAAPSAPGMARPVAGGPAGPVGGPASPLQQMGSMVPTDEMHTRQLQGTTDQGATGRARQNTYNEMTAQQAARRKAQEGVLSSLRQQNVIGQSADDLLAKLPGMTATPSGILAPSSAVYPTAPSAPPVPPQAPPQPGALSKAGQGLKQAAGAVLRSPVVMGALGGVSAMEGAQETQKRFSEGDMPGAAIASTGVVGGGLQMVPSVPTKAFGAMISAASPLTLYLYDKLRGQGVQEPQEPTQQELDIASRPAFGMYPKPMRLPPLRPRTFAPGENNPPVESYR
jgi:hypothetical protein